MVCIREVAEFAQVSALPCNVVPFAQRHINILACAMQLLLIFRSPSFVALT